MLNKKMMWFLFIGGLMTQSLEAAKYMLGVRQAGEPMYGDQDSTRKVEKDRFCISVLMVEGTVSGELLLMESKSSDVMVIPVNDNQYWQVCIPNASVLVKGAETVFTMADGDLVAQLRGLLGDGTEFLFESESWHLYSRQSMSCGDSLSRRCASMQMLKSPGHRRSRTSDDLDVDGCVPGFSATSPVVAVYGDNNTSSSRRFCFSRRVPGYFEGSIPCAPRREEDDGEGEERVALMDSILRYAGIDGALSEGSESDDDDTRRSNSGNEADDDSVCFDEGGEAKPDTSKDMDDVD